MDGANVANEYTYDANGNLTRDLNKNITSISYNVLNLPSVVTYSNGNTVTYGYDGTGNKLSVAYQSGSTTTKTEYIGNKIYKNGTLSMILTEEGYVTLSGTTPTYYYYLKDHQGNNHVVINQSGMIQQVNHYYPFGGLFGEGIQTSNQRYKYNDKELDRTMELDMYDISAINAGKTVGRIQARSVKEFKTLVQQLSKPGSKLNQAELNKLRTLAQKYGGNVRVDLTGVKGTGINPHVHIEGLGKSVESRHIWLELGVK